MSEAQTYAWILLSISHGGGTRKEIARVADGINNAIPTHQEMDSSLRWLLKNGLISETDGQFALTESGKALIGKIRSSALVNGWDALSKAIETI